MYHLLILVPSHVEEGPLTSIRHQGLGAIDTSEPPMAAALQWTTLPVNTGDQSARVLHVGSLYRWALEARLKKNTGLHWVN